MRNRDVPIKFDFVAWWRPALLRSTNQPSQKGLNLAEVQFDTPSQEPSTPAPQVKRKQTNKGGKNLTILSIESTQI